MTEPFLAEIRIFPFNFFPKGWAFCDGQVLPIAQNTALFPSWERPTGATGGRPSPSQIYRAPSPCTPARGRVSLPASWARPGVPRR